MDFHFLKAATKIVEELEQEFLEFPFSIGSYWEYNGKIMRIDNVINEKTIWYTDILVPSEEKSFMINSPMAKEAVEMSKRDIYKHLVQRMKEELSKSKV